MPRVNGIMQPIPGAYGVPDTPIESAKYNSQLDDLVADANNARPVTAGGIGSQTAVGGADNLSTTGSDIASAATTNLAAATGVNITITGTTAITGFGTAPVGAKRWITFAGALTLTYDATKLILPGAANITTAAGDTCVALSLGSGNWRVVSYQPISGKAVKNPSATDLLAAIKTVDGEDSGLDADLLDGEEGAFYTNAANMTGSFGGTTVGVVTSTAGTALGWAVRGNSFDGTKFGILGYQNRYSFYGNGELLNTGPVTITGNMTLTGDAALNGLVSTSSGVYQGSATNAILSALGVSGVTGGRVFLRPKGYNDSTAQALLDGNGDFTVTRNVLAGGSLSAGNGNFISGAGSAILATAGAGSVYLRPRGASDATGQSYAAWDGTGFGFFQSPRIYSDGRVYANGGAAFLETNGNVYGTNWGGYLDAWLATNYVSSGGLPAKIAALNVGAVGTYAFCRSTSGLSPGNTVAGSSLTYAGAVSAVSTNPSGSWRCMGWTNGNPTDPTLFLRYA